MYKPMLNDEVERWLRAHRDAGEDLDWRMTVSDLIDDYREHARLGLRLDEAVPEG